MNKASETMKRKYGEDYFSRIAKKQAKKYAEDQKKGIAKPRGFAKRKDLASKLGRKGGKISKRRSSKSSNSTTN